MPRLLINSKYWVLCFVGAAAFALSNVYIMLTPSIGLCLMPLTVSGALMPVASRMVGTISMTWWNWVRTPPGSLMWPGQLIAKPWRVPPKCDATCLVHLNGVSKAQDQATAMCGYVSAEPHLS